MNDQSSQNLANAFLKLKEVLDTLRRECPWDRKQTLKSLRHLTIEETYELSEAILDENYNELKKELGDIILHVLFYSKIAEEQKKFTTEEMLDEIVRKLIRRHPHVYGDTSVDGAGEVSRNWEEIKMQEKGKISVLDGVPDGLPALVKAYRIQEKVSNVGFDWDEKKQVWEKLQEELDELKDAEKNGNQDEIEKETGDVFFALVNYARFIHVNPEDALEGTNRKFIRRFQYIESAAQAKGKKLKEMTLEEMDELWDAAKKEE